jgi:hypothetical protein
MSIDRNRTLGTAAKDFAYMLEAYPRFQPRRIADRSQFPRTLVEPPHDIEGLLPVGAEPERDDEPAGITNSRAGTAAMQVTLIETKGCAAIGTILCEMTSLFKASASLMAQSKFRADQGSGSRSMTISSGAIPHQGSCQAVHAT